MTTLHDFRPGDRGRVVGLRAGGALGQRLLELGFVPGAPVRLVRVAPFGDPLEVEVHRCHFALRRADAARVEVERR